MMDYSISELVNRHRLSLAQIDRLGWAEVAKEDLLQEKIQALAQAHQIRNVLDQLEETGIPFICIKGFALSQRVYQDPTLRFANDVDILIPDRNDVVSLRQKLLAKGWLDPDDFWVDDQQRRDWYMDLTMHFRLLDPKKEILVEVHWKLDWLLLNIEGNKLRDFLKSHTQRMGVFNREVNVLSPELELLYLIAHGARHAWFRLKWLVDIYHYPFSLVDESKFKNLVKKFDLFHLVAQTHELLKIYFGASFHFHLKGKVNSLHLNFYKSKIKENLDLEVSSPSVMNFTKNIIHFFGITGNIDRSLRMIVRTIGVRPQDISDAKFDALWKYFFYRYYSIFQRKVGSGIRSS